MQLQRPYIFDGHNDVLSRMLSKSPSSYQEAFAHGWDGHIDVLKAEAGGLGAGFFAVFVSSGDLGGSILDLMQGAEYDLPLPSPLQQAEAETIAWQQVEILKTLEAYGLINICTSVAQINDSVAGGTMAAILHMEGAEAIGPDLAQLDALYAAGLRSLGLVWSRPTIFGEGVPFRFPSTSDIGGGLTGAGRDLVRRCNSLGIMLDVSHLNEAGFWDLAATTGAPIVATHSNAHAICPHSRNLTDKQLAAIAESGGVVGLNYATAMLRADGRMVADTPVSQMIRHLEHLLGFLGEDGVALGSDFDGATVPEAIGDAGGLDVLRSAMKDAGFGTELIHKICHRNWLNVLARTWHS
ncbi:Membrane dipeptidase (Peptidase family M19) [Falsiruegeria litorea R37]|uniref:Membrane dipeptidase (Peptidase family M19) n=1 Tax=Falsiruegeria litorea R37 TaxID=1200284 RepID=A0A1Y5TMF3_9RHOB|nr:dipeptidase [Falsiruegeria litorea]SLN66989.1 Membrane dipeptidase (Peptidase family M19) [Falsiruegeria litorea R37]